MRVLAFGTHRLTLDISDLHRPDLIRLVCEMTTEDSLADATATLRVVEGEEAHLLVDKAAFEVVLTVPAKATVPSYVIAIGVLQAAARCLASLTASERTLLLHGSAVRNPTGGAIAIVDGGRGAGKTSLAIGLSRLSYELMVDEFLFVDLTAKGILVTPARYLPWHVRDDMAHLVPEHRNVRLLYPQQIRPMIESSKPAILEATLVPDQSLPSGVAERIDSNQISDALVAAATDHLMKLVDPSLDHVSIFQGAQAVRSTSGPLVNQQGVINTPPVAALAALAAVPAWRVGIGGPAEIMRSVRAVINVLER